MMLKLFNIMLTRKSLQKTEFLDIVCFFNKKLRPQAEKFVKIKAVKYFKVYKKLKNVCYNCDVDRIG